MWAWMRVMTLQNSTWYGASEVISMVTSLFRSRATFLVTVANVPLSVSSNSPTGQTAGLDPTLTIVFSESIQAGTGNVQLFSTSPENLEETFDVSSSPNLAFSGNTLTIDPSISLTSGKTYNVRFDSGAIVEAGNGDGWGGLATPSTCGGIDN